MSDPAWPLTAMTATDLQVVHEIDCQSPSPWSFRQLEEEMAVPGGQQLLCRSLALGRPAGFLLVRIVLDEAEILKLATSREFHRRGVASRLLEAFIATARDRQLRRINLELRAANSPALALYEKFAFEMTGRRPNYYTAPIDDALCLTRFLKQAAYPRTNPVRN
jgi:ribosomal-protein-alanine N-acetyltransferase